MVVSGVNVPKSATGYCLLIARLPSASNKETTGKIKYRPITWFTIEILMKLIHIANHSPNVRSGFYISKI